MGATTTNQKHLAGWAISMATATGLIVIGIPHEEMGEVMFNACMLCLSCIGIG